MKLARCIIAIALLSSGLSSLAYAQTIRTVALTGELAPGATDGATFSSFDFPVIDAQGRVTFRANLSGISSTFPATGGIWSESTGNLSKVAYRGDQAAGTSVGTTYSSIGTPIVSDSGQVIFSSSLAGADVNDEKNTGIWFGTSETLELVIREGDPVPGAQEGVSLDGIGIANAVLNSPSVELALNSNLVGPGIDSSNNSAIWKYKDGALLKIAQEGDQAPGLPSGVTMRPEYSVYTSNSEGNSTFTATLSGPGIDGTNQHSIWSETDGTLRLIARTGDHVLGMSNSVKYEDFFAFGNQSGKTIFYAQLEGAGITESNNRAIWQEHSGILTPIMQEGAQVHGMPEGTIFEYLLPRYVDTNSAGELAIHADYSGGTGLWSGGTDALTLVASLGEHAPGTIEDGSFYSFQSGGPALNSEGHIAFLASWLDPHAVRPNPRIHQGLWAQDSSGILKVVAKNGDQLEVAPNDFRTIDFIRLIGAIKSAGYVDERLSSHAFNDSNQLAFWAEFVDGSTGIFVSSFNAIPEPSTLFLTTLALAGALIKRRR